MPAKWIIFRVTNYLHILCLLFYVVVMGFAVTDETEAATMVVFALFLLCILILLANSINNLYLLEKFYPEKVPGSRLSTYSRVLFISSLPVLGFLTILTVAIFYVEYFEDDPTDISGVEEPRSTTIALVAILLLTLLTGIYNVCLQVALRRTIRKNFEAGLDNFLEPETP